MTEQEKQIQRIINLKSKCVKYMTQHPIGNKGWA
jgi:hypothetical protein